MVQRSESDLANIRSHRVPLETPPRRFPNSFLVHLASTAGRSASYFRYAKLTAEEEGCQKTRLQ